MAILKGGLHWQLGFTRTGTGDDLRKRPQVRIAMVVQMTLRTMVYGRYIYTIPMVYKPTNITGGASLNQYIYILLLVGGFKHELYFPLCMGCHPSH